MHMHNIPRAASPFHYQVAGGHPLAEEPFQLPTLGYPDSASVETFMYGFQASAYTAGQSLYSDSELLFLKAMSHLQRWSTCLHWLASLTTFFLHAAALQPTQLVPLGAQQLLLCPALC